MKTIYYKNKLKLSVVTSIALLSACSFFGGEEGTNQSGNNDYRDAVAEPALNVSPPLSDELINDLYPIPAVSAEVDDVFFDKKNPPLPQAMLTNADDLIQLQTLSNEQWVFIRRSPSQVWVRLKQYSVEKGFNIVFEQAGSGYLELSLNDLNYRYKLIQGFQRNSSELSLRVTYKNDANQALWPEKSDDADEERSQLRHLATYFAQNITRSSYSAAALSISTDKRMRVSVADNGWKTIALKAEKERALGSFRLGLEAAGFELQTSEVKAGIIIAQYKPPVPKEKQPGFFKRMFGAKIKPFDDTVPYAGNTYHFQIQALADASFQIEMLERAETYVKKGPKLVALPKKEPSIEELQRAQKREYNSLIMRLKRAII